MKNEIYVEGETLFIETEKEVKKAEPLLENDNSELDYEDEEFNQNYPSDQIRIEKTTFSIFELNRITHKAQKKSKVDEPFQRNDVWSPRQRIELIESVLMGLPLPLFYFSKNSDGVMIVVDGRQRLTTFRKFLNDEFELKNLKYLSSSYENKKFSALSALDQSKIEDFQLQVYLIVPPTPPRVMFDIFFRVNSAGTSLNKQEIRNAMYSGASTKLLNELAASEEFKKITSNVFEKDNRMKAQYLLLRLISFYLWRNRNMYSNDSYLFTTTDVLFIDAMKLINRLGEIEYCELKEKLKLSFKLYDLIFTTDDFRVSSGKTRSAINMNLFEIMLYIFLIVPPKTTKNQIKNSIEKIKSDNAFTKNIYKHRDGKQDVIERFTIAETILGEISND